MKTKQTTRSKEPLLWLGFSASGMWAAMVLPVMVLVFAFMMPMTLTWVTQFFILFVQNVWGRLFIGGTLILLLWCGAHRITHTLGDLRITFPGMHAIFYLMAVLGAIFTLVLLVQLGG